MDILSTIQADSTQVNAADLVQPITVTVSGVTWGTKEQPINILLEEFPDRAYRPCKSMRRVLAAAWGADASAWIGRRITLFNDPTVRWGGIAVGGVRISHLSDINSRLSLPLVNNKKAVLFTVDPLPAAPTVDVDELKSRITAAATLDDLDAIAAELKSCDLGNARSTVQTAWTARRNELKTPPPPPAADADYGDLLDAAAEGVK